MADMKRREFIAAGGAIGLPLQAAAMQQSAPRYTGNPQLKITDVQVFLVNAGRNYVYVKISTDQGIHGWGEAYSAGPDEATAATVRDFREWLVGKDPRNVEYLWATLYNFTRFPGGLVVNAAISGIEHALWDIAGKAAGLPVYMLLGGKCREKVRVYQSASGRTPQQLAENAKDLIAKYGYTAIKTAPHPSGSQSMPYNAVTRAAGERAEALRQAVGPENMDSMAELRRRSPIPIATGEELYTKFQFQQLLSQGGADIIQPDICLAGGILEQKKIAAIAESHYTMVAPHNPLGPLATLVNIHFAASTPNFIILEYHPDDEAPRKNLIKGDTIVAKNGYLEIPDKPGWGYEMNEEAFKSMPAKPWRRAPAFRADGSPDFI